MHAASGGPRALLCAFSGRAAASALVTRGRVPKRVLAGMPLGYGRGCGSRCTVAKAVQPQTPYLRRHGLTRPPSVGTPVGGVRSRRAVAGLDARWFGVTVRCHSCASEPTRRGRPTCTPQGWATAHARKARAFSGASARLACPLSSVRAVQLPSASRLGTALLPRSPFESRKPCERTVHLHRRHAVR